MTDNWHGVITGAVAAILLMGIFDISGSLWLAIGIPIAFVWLVGTIYFGRRGFQGSNQERRDG